MKNRHLLTAAATMVLVACGGGGDAEQTNTVEADTAAAMPAGTVDTAGTGVNPPTAGGQVVDTAAVPGAIDTVAGTPTAP